jgi:hypothetical protein
MCHKICDFHSSGLASYPHNFREMLGNGNLQSAPAANAAQAAGPGSMDTNIAR